MKLRVTYSQSSTRNGLYAYGLHVSVRPADPDDSNDSNDSNDPADAPDCGVFVFRRSTPGFDPMRQFPGMDRRSWDEFWNVATPVDMHDIPRGEPDIPGGMPYFRLPDLDLWFRNLEDLLRAKREIGADIADLCRLTDALDDVSSYESSETVEYGG